MINILNSSERAKGITCYQYLIALNKYPVNEWLVPYIKEYLIKFTMNVQWSHYYNIFPLNYRGSMRILFANRGFCGGIATTCFITLVFRIRNLNTRPLHAIRTLYKERHSHGLTSKSNKNEKRTFTKIHKDFINILLHEKCWTYIWLFIYIWILFPTFGLSC